MGWVANRGNLPGFVVLQSGLVRGLARRSRSNWGSGFLPTTTYQGHLARTSAAPILDLENPMASPSSGQQFEFIGAATNSIAGDSIPRGSGTATRIASYEMARSGCRRVPRN
ncbi:MAG: DUF1501 domain-containing protein [Pirellulales bacterium]